MEEYKEIKEKPSVLFLSKKLQELSEGKNGLEIKYEYREWSDTHAIEINSLKKLTKAWISLMYEFNDEFNPERIIFILQNTPSSLRVKEPLFIFKSEFAFTKAMNKIQN